MYCSVVFVVAILFATAVAQQKLPSYIKACQISKPDFQQCALKHARDAVPDLVKGDKRLGIPKLDPLHLPLIEIQHSGFSLILKNAKVTGLKDIKVTTLHMDRSVFEGTFHIELLNILSNYNSNGRVLVVNLDGNGASNITAVGGDYNIKSNFSRITKNGYSFLKFGQPQVDFTLKRAYFHLENLVNGDERLGAEVNKILNDNWESVLTDIGAPIKEAVSAVIESIVSNILEKVPENELFID